MNEIPAEFELMIEDRHLDEVLKIPIEDFENNICQKCIIAVAFKEKFPEQSKFEVGFSGIRCYGSGGGWWNGENLKFTGISALRFRTLEKEIRAMFPISFKFKSSWRKNN